MCGRLRSVLEPELVAGVHRVLQHERRHLGRVEELELRGLHLDLAGRELGVDHAVRPRGDLPTHRHDVLGA
jgi:hypothetical protein